MVATKLRILLLCNTVYVFDCARRILNGVTVSEGKPYMVYLVEAPKSNKDYNDWMCGGALVSSSVILTSAACVEDVEHMYAVLGLSTYQYGPQYNPNTKTCNDAYKKVIYICVPINYRLSYEKTSKWSYMDIALVEIEIKDGDVWDCDFKPSHIPVSYDARITEPGTDAFVLGFGHDREWGQPGDGYEYNSVPLKYASVRIEEKEVCKKAYSDQMGEVIDKFMICSSGRGMLNDQGEPLVPNTNKNKPLPGKLDGCKKQEIPRSIHDILDGPDDDSRLVVDKTRKDGCLRSNPNLNNTSTEKESRKVFNNTRIVESGICQNDHGGPLVTWLGSQTVVIGIASVFKVDPDSNACQGPFLYTSTRSMMLFLDCHLNKTRRSICDSPPIQRGYDVIERHIIWDKTPIGRAVTNRTLENLKIIEKYGNIEKFWKPTIREE